ncbi:MAG: hypothetical protein ACSW8E_00720 [Clostridia bacterium]
MKKLFSLLLVLLLLLPAVCGAPAAGAESLPQGTEGFTEISDLDGLLAIADDPDGKYILTADIDMAGVIWQPIPFRGTLDGAGHTLYNLQIRSVGEETLVTRDGNLKPYDTVFAGLFSVLENASILDLKLVGAKLEVESHEHCFAGLLAGYMYRSSIQGCSVQGQARLVNYAVQSGIGGIVGYGAGDFGFCRAEVELVFEDRNLESRCEQFMGGVLSCGLANIEDCIVHIDGYDSCHGYVHNGGLVGMYYYCGMDVHAQSVRRNEIYGQITFFEDNPNRRAYCEPTLGEGLSMPGNYYGNESEFERNEVFDYDKVLRPDKCEVPEVHATLVPPTCEDWGYVVHECVNCGYSWADSYFPPQHTPGDWEIVTPADETHEGVREKHCTLCGELLEHETFAYEPPEPVVTEEAVTIRGADSTETLGVVFRGSARAMHAEGAAGTLIWRSEDPEIASVDPDGTIHGLKHGETVVRYDSEDGYFHGVCQVTVYYSFWQWLLIVFFFGWLWYV